MFKSFTTNEIRVLSSVKKFKVERKIPFLLVLTAAIAVSLCIGYLFGLIQADSVAKINCEVTGVIK